MGIGLYGKLPARGDFLTRRLPHDFVAVWDAWLQDMMDGSRDALGDDWNDIYMTFPIWRFVLPAGTAGVAPIAGILLPSADKVGRCFPLTLATVLDTLDRPFAQAMAAEAWFDQLDPVSYAALDESVAFEAIDSRLAGFAPIPDPPAPVRDDFMLETGGDLAGIAAAFVPVGDGRGIWWTRGSDRVAPRLIAREGLPDLEHFLRMLGQASFAPDSFAPAPAFAAMPPDLPRMAEPPALPSSPPELPPARVAALDTDPPDMDPPDTARPDSPVDSPVASGETSR